MHRKGTLCLRLTSKTVIDTLDTKVISGKLNCIKTDNLKDRTGLNRIGLDQAIFGGPGTDRVDSTFLWGILRWI